MLHTQYMYMESNKIERVCFACPFLLFLLLFITNIGNAQKITKYYRASFQENGVLYHISPIDVFTNDENNCKFIFDITYLTTNDSAILNLSYFDKTIRIIDSIAFIQNNIKIYSNAKKIFIEPHRTIWLHRYSTKFSFDDLTYLYSQKDKPEIVVYSSSGNINLDIKQSAWRKNAAIVAKIFTMIRLNLEK